MLRTPVPACPVHDPHPATATDGQHITVYCTACGGWKPMGHGCQ
ncbi:hypothetical protein [Streptomyces sp. NPDC002559]